jgi:hypothetical protein
MKRIALVLSSIMVIGLIGSAHAAPKPKTVWEDPSGDATIGGQTPQSLPGGWDLTGATIAKSGANLEFTVTHADMPPTGSGPEVTRFVWSFAVDGEPYRFTVKSVDIGKPDVAGGQTTERVGRVDVAGHFRLEGECVTVTTGIGFVNCPPLEYLEGSFDPAAMSFTIILPLASVKAKTGSVISQGPDVICTICWVSHYAERSLSPTTVIDSAVQTVAYKVPKK